MTTINPIRPFYGATHLVSDGHGDNIAVVRTSGGMSRSDGSTDPAEFAIELHVYEDILVGSAPARRFAQALLEAADELDGWAR